MSHYVILLLIAALNTSCLSVRIPLNVPPKTHVFSEDEIGDKKNLTFDSSKTSILVPVLLIGGTGYVLGAASYNEGMRPSAREKFQSYNAIAGGSICAMFGLAVGYSQWKNRITNRSYSKDQQSVASGYDDRIPERNIMKWTLAGTGIGYALGSLTYGSHNRNFSSRAWLGKGSFIGAMLGAGYGNMFVRGLNRKSLTQLPESLSESKIVNEPNISR